MKKSLITLAALAMVSAPAFAINNTFKFQVFSSGADIFPCNAGIAHPGATTKNGYIIDGEMPSGYGSDIAKDSETNTTPAGAHFPDYMKYTTTDFDEWANSKIEEHGPSTVYGRNSENFTAIHGGAYLNLSKASEISINDKDNAHKVNDTNYIVSSLDFVLSSENFGAKYFVDVCYYSPQFLETLENGTLNITSNISFSDMTGMKSLEKSAIKYSLEVYCDGENFSHLAKSGEFADSQRLNLLTNKRLPVNGSNVVPNKCVVRYTFTENSNLRRNHAKQGGIFTLITDITDPN